MKPIRPLTLALLAALLLVVPSAAEEHNPHHGPHHAGPGPHHGGGMHYGYAPAPQRMHRHHKGHHAGLRYEDQKLLQKYPPRQHSADYSWHPNRLRAAAIEFLASDVYRLAILPFNDFSSLAPTHHNANEMWAERTLRDTLAGSLLETGILVLPAENIEAAVIELKGLPDMRTSAQNQSDPLGMIFRNTAAGGDYSSLAMGELRARVQSDRSRMGLSANGGSALSHLGIDYTPEELRMISDALDVDGIMLGSIGQWGDVKSGGLLGLFNSKRGELAVNIYVADGATGEPIYGKRIEVRTGKNWWGGRQGRSIVTELSRDFTGALMRDLSHPVPAWYVKHLRHVYGLEKAPKKEFQRVHTAAPRERRSGDANIQRWKQYTHHVDANDRGTRRERVANEVAEERDLKRRQQRARSRF